MRTFWRSAHAQPRVYTHNARSSIFLIKDMLFEYLIAIVAQKPKFLCFLEILSFLEKIEKLKFFIFEKISNLLNFQANKKTCIFELQ